MNSTHDITLKLTMEPTLNLNAGVDVSGSSYGPKGRIFLLLRHIYIMKSSFAAR